MGALDQNRPVQEKGESWEDFRARSRTQFKFDPGIGPSSRSSAQLPQSPFATGFFKTPAQRIAREEKVFGAGNSSTRNQMGNNAPAVPPIGTPPAPPATSNLLSLSDSLWKLSDEPAPSLFGDVSDGDYPQTITSSSLMGKRSPLSRGFRSTLY